MCSVRSRRREGRVRLRPGARASRPPLQGTRCQQSVQPQPDAGHRPGGGRGEHRSHDTAARVRGDRGDVGRERIGHPAGRGPDQRLRHHSRAPEGQRHHGPEPSRMASGRPIEHGGHQPTDHRNCRRAARRSRGRDALRPAPFPDELLPARSADRAGAGHLGPRQRHRLQLGARAARRRPGGAERGGPQRGQVPRLLRQRDLAPTQGTGAVQPRPSTTGRHASVAHLDRAAAPREGVPRRLGVLAGDPRRSAQPGRAAHVRANR